jgi:alkylation response protein AidB-like acyl-CoA dehydrogenase
MDFHLTEAQSLLVSTAHDFFQHHCPTTLVQELALDPHGFSEPLWRQIAALGWPGLLIPSAFEGHDGDVLDVMLLLEEIGYACFPSPFIHSAVVATALLLAAGSQSQKQRLLPALARGERRCTLALTEASATFSLPALTLVGEVGGRLNGSKLFVKDAHIADDLIVGVRGGGGINVFLLPRLQPGITLLALDTMSGEKLFEVMFTDVPLAAETLLGTAGSGGDILQPALQLGALARSAESVGCAQRILDLCTAYAKVREQSGRPIGAFQAIQHHCADMLRHVEGSRYSLYHAAWKIQAGLPCTADVAMTKAHISTACLQVARTGHQIMGAIGYCEEHPLHLFHKRIQAAGLDFGDAALHLETVATAIGLV